MFREEAIDHQRLRFHGSIVLTQPRSTVALTLLFCAIAAAIVAFTFLAGFSRKENVAGVLVPERGLVQVAAPQGGAISDIKVAEGQPARSGQTLLVITSERVGAAGDNGETIAARLRARLDKLRLEARSQGTQTQLHRRELDARMAHVRESIAQVGAQLALQRQRARIATDTAERYPELVRSGAVSEVEASERRAEAMEQQARVTSLQRTELDLQRELSGLLAQQAELPLASAREASQLQRSIDELEQQLAEHEVSRSWVVRADADGTVASLRVARGQSVAPGAPLLDIVPAGGALCADLFVPTRAVGFVQVGAPVRLRYDAYPYQKFGQHTGQVQEIASSPTPVAELRQLGAAFTGSGEPLYRVRVKLDAQSVHALGAERPLRPGMQLSASLILERRTLAEWAVAPLFTLTGRL